MESMRTLLLLVTLTLIGTVAYGAQRAPYLVPVGAGDYREYAPILMGQYVEDLAYKIAVAIAGHVDVRDVQVVEAPE